MTTETTASPGNGGGEQKNNSRLLLVLLLLILLVAGAVYYFWPRSAEGVVIGENGEFSFTFRGCDEEERCATFTIYAPGLAYAWDYRRTVPTALTDDTTPFGDQIIEDLQESDGIIVAGLASSEGDDRFNAFLSTCRARALEDIVVDLRDEAGASTPIYRVALGRYTGEGGLVTAGVSEGGQGAQTRRQRVLVVAFVADEDQGIDRAEALRRGAAERLQGALNELLEVDDADAASVAQQLDFSAYSCWSDFEVVPLGGLAQTCFTEHRLTTDVECRRFGN